MTSSLTNFVVSIMFLKVFPASGINGIMRYRNSPKSLLACKVLMECCVYSMQFYTIHAKKIDDIPMLPILYDKMELYGIYQASGHCTS